MEILKDYVITALAASVLTSVLGSLASDSMKGHIKFITGLIMIVILVVPLLAAINEFVSALSDTYEPLHAEENTGGYEMTDGIVKEFKYKLEASAAETAANLYGIDSEEVSAEAYIDDSDITNISIEKIKIKVKGAVLNERVKAELENLYHCDVEIITSDRQERK